MASPVKVTNPEATKVAVFVEEVARLEEAAKEGRKGVAKGEVVVKGEVTFFQSAKGVWYKSSFNKNGKKRTKRATDEEVAAAVAEGEGAEEVTGAKGEVASAHKAYDLATREEGLSCREEASRLVASARKNYDLAAYEASVLAGRIAALYKSYEEAQEDSAKAECHLGKCYDASVLAGRIAALYTCYNEAQEARAKAKCHLGKCYEALETLKCQWPL